MENKQRIENLLEMCEDLQSKVHLRESNTNVDSLRFSCDLLLRNMIMILDQERQGKSFTHELNYLTNNLLGAHSKLTKTKASDTALKYQIKV